MHSVPRRTFLALALAAALSLAAVVPALAAVPAPAQATGQQADNLYQVSTLEALLAGLYQGTVDFAQLARHGDLGLGTFDALDGEMVAVDGEFYQVKASGEVLAVKPEQTSPFANLVWFRPEKALDVSGVKDLASLEGALLKALPSRNLICAIRVSGRFASIKARSVPGQKPPYPPLVEVVKHQSVWTWQDQEGDLVGFFFPPYLQGLNVNGFHLHYISKDRQRGGHLLEAKVDSAQAMIDVIYGMDLDLPHSAEFQRLNLGQDTSKAVHKVER